MTFFGSTCFLPSSPARSIQKSLPEMSGKTAGRQQRVSVKGEPTELIKQVQRQKVAEMVARRECRFKRYF
ncbi:hypothetical protein [Paraburkholderia sp. HD33-4]|uniref:hypothetical protein n=1 Tax=Paraburkholderia sp. HD33-4 TaxID=2883242 RepID=UPI001F438F2C|nr:hypothetical protein [Paraburkholderia sp. HD33-4]